MAKFEYDWILFLDILCTLVWRSVGGSNCGLGVNGVWHLICCFCLFFFFFFANSISISLQVICSLTNVLGR